MNEEYKVAIGIQARIEDILGTEKISEQMSQAAQRITGTTAQKNFADVMEQPEFKNVFSEEDQKQFDKIRRANDAAMKRMQQESEDMMNEYLTEEGQGLTKTGAKKWQRRFERAGREQKDWYEGQIEPFLDRTIERETDSDKLEKLNALKVAHKESTESIAKDYKELGDNVRYYHDQLSKSTEATNNFFETLRKAGYFAVGGMALNQAAQVLVGEQQIAAKNLNSFDLTSPLGMYTERQKFDIFQQTKERGLKYGSAGAIIGGGLGALTGNPLAAAALMGFGKHVGKEISDYIQLPKTSEIEQNIKFLRESYDKIAKDVSNFATIKIPAQKIGIRFGQTTENMEKTEGIGYTPQEEVKFRETFGTQLGRFDEQRYEQQLIFARSLGLNPNDVFQLNKAGRITGQAYDLMTLNEGKEYTKSIFGENADTQRIIDVLNAIKDTSLEQLRVNINANANNAAVFAMLPKAMFGTETAYGRPGDLGGQSVNLLEQMGKPSTKAQQAFLYQAYGEDNLMQFTERLKGGIFYEDNLSKILQTAQRYTGGNEMQMYFLLNDLMKDQAPAGFIPRLIETMKGKDEEGRQIYQDKEGKRFYENAAGEFFNEENKKVEPPKDIEKVNLSTLLDQLKQLNKPMSDEERKDAIEKLMQPYHDGAKKAATDFETTQEKVANIQKEIGESYRQMILDSQKRMAELERGWLKAEETQIKMSQMIDKGLDAILGKLGELGVFVSPEHVEQTYKNKSYNAVYEATGKTVGDVLRPEEIVKIKEEGGDVWEAYAKKALAEKFTVEQKNTEGKVVWQETDTDKVNSTLKALREERLQLRAEAEAKEKEVFPAEKFLTGKQPPEEGIKRLQKYEPIIDEAAK